MDTLSLAKKHFGITSFRGDQESIINASLANKDILVVQGTGFGKSLCFQLPAIIRSGITLVISPLVALMDDQVSHLMEKGIWATAIHRNLDQDETQHRLDLLHLHQYHLLYLSPEKLASKKFLAELSVLPISHLVVDEAHCISEWGHQFRPDYRNITSIRRYLNRQIAVSAFTATAPTWVQQDILTTLDMTDATIFGGSIIRQNIFLDTHFCELELDKWMYLLRELANSALVSLERKTQCSIIMYVLTRTEAEQLSELVNSLWTTTHSKPFSAAYHAGLDPLVRQSLQHAFQTGQIPCIIATNAFGMGVDKGNVRLVVLYGAPASPESLLQQVGRAGRDGKSAKAVILYSQRDFTVHQQLQSKYSGKVARLVHHRLRNVATLLSTNRCRWQSLAKYYNESTYSCGRCDSCTHATNSVSFNADTIHAKSLQNWMPVGDYKSQRLKSLFTLLSESFPYASLNCLPGLGKGIINHEYNKTSEIIKRDYTARID